MEGFIVEPVVIRIVDDDFPSTKITLTVRPSSLPERAGARRVTVEARLDGAPLVVPEGGGDANDITVDLDLTGGSTATVDVDYTLAASSASAVTIPAGRRSGTAVITISPIHDTFDEGESETITVVGSVATGTPGGRP